MTLNHWVPGSSPGAPTKLFKTWQLWIDMKSQPRFRPRSAVLFSRRALTPLPPRANVAAKGVGVEDGLDIPLDDDR